MYDPVAITEMVFGKMEAVGSALNFLALPSGSMTV
jgi:hypothetical protein